MPVGWPSPPAASTSSSPNVYQSGHRHHQDNGSSVSIESRISWPSPPPSASSVVSSSPIPVAALASPVRRKPVPQQHASSPVNSSRLSGLSSTTASTTHRVATSGTSLSPVVKPTADPSLQLDRAVSSSPVAVRTNLPTSHSSSYSITSAVSSVYEEDASHFVPKDLDRSLQASTSAPPLRIDTSAPYWDKGDGEETIYTTQFSNGTPVHSRLVSEPFIPILSSPVGHRRTQTMALHPASNRPPPLRLDSGDRVSLTGSLDLKQPKTPGNKISSFFGWKATTTSPGAESSSTEISDSGRSPLPSSMPPSVPTSHFSIIPSTTVPFDPTRLPVRNSSVGSASIFDAGSASKLAELENELREISSELAGSIRREMELEDLVERLQSELPADAANRRTSDYFSDSGASIRYIYDANGKIDDLEKYRRSTEQERAQLKVELSQKWQEERARRTATESHIQILESQVHQLRRERVESSDLTSKARELELALEDTRRKLAEERQIKDNFEDLLTAMRVELEQLRNERDHLRENVIPQVQQQQHQHQQQPPPPPPTPQSTPTPDSSEIERLVGEIEALKIENASLAQLQGSRFASIAEEDSMPPRRVSGLGLSRSNSLARMHSKPSGSNGLSRSNSLSRANSVATKDRENRETLADRIEDVEAQRDALHQALRYMLLRQEQQAREYEKRTRVLEMELVRAQEAGSPRKLGYEWEVRNLREEVNHLRQRAEDALEQKWQCEKGLAGLKMDLDRAEEETSSLRVLLQEHDINVPNGTEINRDEFAEVIATSSSLEMAFKQLQADREHAAQSPLMESNEFVASVGRTDALSSDVQEQLQRNSSLRSRLAEAINKGEKEQQVSATRINELQSRLKDLEDTLVMAQQHSEDEMARHEEEIHNLEVSHNAQLMRMRNGSRSPAALSPKPPSTPFGARSPRLDKTTSGDGMSLTEAIQSEMLEKRVKELEKLLRDADTEMEEVVSRMNRAQINVAELQSDRDEALRQTRRLQAEILAEREAFKALMAW